MVHKIRVMTVLAAIGLALVAAHAGGGPENVAVVVNADSWASLAVANEFVALRGIPPGNLIYLGGVSHFDHVPLAYFRQRLLAPALQVLRERGLAGQIDYLVYSADLPTKADAWADLSGEKALDRMPRHCAQPWLATTALTFLYEPTLAANPAYLDLNANLYSRSLKQERWDDAPWTDEQRAQRREAEQFFRERERRAAERAKSSAQPTEADLQWEREGLAAALQRLSALAAAHPNSAPLLYDLACTQALSGKPQEALDSLQAAVQGGWFDGSELARDPDLASLRELPEFKTLVAGLKTREVQVYDSHGFRSSYGWTRGGVAAPGQPAPHYLLSTALAVTSGRGNSVSEAVESLRRSVAADGTRPAGTIYFMRNGDIRSTTRLWAFPSAVSQLQSLGVKAEIVDGVLPERRADVAGLMAGSADFDWPGCGSTMLPGALAEHLTSHGGVMEWWGGQTPITRWLRGGAAGSAGTVAEPFAIFAKFPNPFLHVHYARGCSLAEAFYQSVPGPYHLLILGDPLCQPWARFPELRVSGVKAGDVVSGKVSLSLAKGVDPQALDHLELFVDGLRQAVAKPAEKLVLDTAPLCEGWHELRVVGVAAGPIETQNRVILPIFVRRQPSEFTVTASPVEAPWDQPLSIAVSFPFAREIGLVHNQRTVARLVGAKGSVSIDPRVLGMGPAQLRPVALVGTPPRVVNGAPVEVRVIPPALWPALPAPTEKLTGGLRLQAGSQAPVVVEKLDPPSLEKAGAKPFEQFQLSGWFSAPADETYQFQMRLASGQATLQVDGRTLGTSLEGAWVYLPVPLRQGWHRVSVTGVPQPQVCLEVNFGGPGSYPLGGPTFQCPVP